MERERGYQRHPRFANKLQFQFISCPSCGVKNRVLQEKIYSGPKCGKCKAPLAIAMS